MTESTFVLRENVLLSLINHILFDYLLCVFRQYFSHN